nr:unnamed protein product [Callosobruchus analis]
MRCAAMLAATCLLVLMLDFGGGRVEAGPHYTSDEYYPPSEEDYSDNTLDNLIQKRTPLIYLFRRACIRRGGNCDYRPNDCCYSSSCRCNLWGSNCRCQRMGLFQKWG